MWLYWASPEGIVVLCQESQGYPTTRKIKNKEVWDQIESTNTILSSTRY